MLKQVIVEIGIVRGPKTFFYTWKSCKLASKEAIQAFIKEHTWMSQTFANSFVKRCEVVDVTGKEGER